jgi:hypothetical protein
MLPLTCGLNADPDPDTNSDARHLVRAGAVFKKGVLVENPTEDQVAA